LDVVNFEKVALPLVQARRQNLEQVNVVELASLLFVHKVCGLVDWNCRK